MYSRLLTRTRQVQPLGEQLGSKCGSGHRRRWHRSKRDVSANDRSKIVVIVAGDLGVISPMQLLTRVLDSHAEIMVDFPSFRLVVAENFSKVIIGLSYL